MKLLVNLVLIFPAILSLPAFAQDTTSPSVEIVSAVVVPNKNLFDFIFDIKAADDVAIEGLEFRGKVDGKPLEDWYSYPYFADFPFVATVDCDYFRLDIRSKDTSGNYSSIVSREFRAPFGAENPKEPSLTFSPNAEIVDPPAVSVRNNTATIILKKFSLPKRKSTKLITRAAKLPPKKPTSSITYQVTFKNLSSGEAKKKTSKKNVLALKKLPPGQYSTSYKAELRKNNKVSASTKQSPEATFNIE